MLSWATLEAHLGLIVFTALTFALLVYLGYSMVHPDRF
jgi:hypothetical protein